MLWLWFVHCWQAMNSLICFIRQIWEQSDSTTTLLQKLCVLPRVRDRWEDEHRKEVASVRHNLTVFAAEKMTEIDHPLSKKLSHESDSSVPQICVQSLRDIASLRALQ
mmetsp:Transcript_8519/g.15426  ORF Transcript_8519/g.15426 Transcript_8519/m.15426 type:complete len:108 (-) Transcript_8519:1926-2249(-)